MNDFDQNEIVNDSSSVDAFFNLETVVVTSLCSSTVEFGGHMGRPFYVLDRSGSDADLVAAVRSCWSSDRHSDFDKQQMYDSWDPIREIFGHERYDETNFVHVNRIVRKQGDWSMDIIAIAATGWRNGNRDRGPDSGRFKLDPGVSDEELARSIRVAMDVTKGPHD